MPIPATRLPASQETEDTAPKGPTRTLPEDPEILLEAGEIPDKVNTPEGEAVEFSQDYTLSEDGEGDNINGKQKLRKEQLEEGQRAPTPPAAE